MFEDFNALQTELTKIDVKKTGKAQYGAYVTLGEVMDKVMPAILKHKFILTQQVGNKDGQPVLVTTLAHKDGEVISSEMLLMLKSPDPQSQGSAITYARRYSLMALLGLVGEDDDGNAAQTAATSNTPATTNQSTYISNLMRQKGIVGTAVSETIEEVTGRKFTGKLSSGEASKVIEALKVMPDAVKDIPSRDINEDKEPF